MIYVANWKMTMHATDAIQFCNDHTDELNAIARQQDTTIIICPSFPVLFPITKIFEKTQVFTGAQNCSEHEEGAYTGEVSAQSLSEIGCSYCIIGHSERRKYFNETTKITAQKVDQLLEQEVTPILCIGESQDEFETGDTIQVLKDQLKDPIRVLKKNNNKQNLLIAYEPVWAIGTGTVPREEYLNQIFSWLHSFINNKLPQTNSSLLYGGSVKPYNVNMLKKVTHVNGFLIGGASTDFQTLKKIVS